MHVAESEKIKIFIALNVDIYKAVPFLIPFHFLLCNVIITSNHTAEQSKKQSAYELQGGKT